eukprot:759067-Hanusia_phi.AAC.8
MMLTSTNRVLAEKLALLQSLLQNKDARAGGTSSGDGDKLQYMLLKSEEERYKEKLKSYRTRLYQTDGKSSQYIPSADDAPGILYLQEENDALKVFKVFALFTSFK